MDSVRILVRQSKTTQIQTEKSLIGSHKYLDFEPEMLQFNQKDTEKKRLPRINFSSFNVDGDAVIL